MRSPNIPPGNRIGLIWSRSWLVLLPLALVAAAFVVAMPCIYDHANSGRMLLPVLKDVDPQLFPHDETVEAMRLLQSVFYQGLGYAMRAVGASPESLGWVVTVLYYLSRAVLLLEAWLLARALDRDPWLFLGLTAWFFHQKGSLVGGVPLFRFTVTHGEVAFLLLLAGLYALFRAKLFWFWIALSLGVLIHPLVSIQFALCVLPPLMIFGFKERSGKVAERLQPAGFALLGFCTLLYLLFMKPPNLSPHEMEIFLGAKGKMNHVNPVQPAWDWLRMVGFLALATLGWRRFFPKDRNTMLLMAFAASGTLLALPVAMVAVLGPSADAALFMPMRTFMWVSFFCVIVIIRVTVAAFRSDHVASWLLLLQGVFAILGSLWFPIFLWLAVAVLLLEYVPAVKSLMDQHRVVVARWLCLGSGAVIFAGWGLQRYHTAESLADPVALAISLLMFGAAARSLENRIWQTSVVGLILITGLCATSWRIYEKRVFDANHDWFSVQQWCRDNIPKDARVLIPPGTGNFRVHSLRTPVNERMATFAWFVPHLYMSLERRAAEVDRAYTGEDYDLERLRQLALEWGAAYIITRGPSLSGEEPVSRSGSYHVFAVR